MTLEEFEADYEQKRQAKEAKEAQSTTTDRPIGFGGVPASTRSGSYGQIPPGAGALDQIEEWEKDFELYMYGGMRFDRGKQ